MVTLLVTMLISGMALLAPKPAYAATGSPFTLAMAEQMALASSSEIKKIYNQILLKKINYTDAVTSINAKMRNKRTLRWTPLLSFKFPEKLTLSDEFELNVKPQAMMSEITTLQHQMNDESFAVIANVRTAYFKAYVLQEKNAFTQDMLDAATKNLARNKARLLAGQAKQADIDTMEKTVKKLTEDVARQLRELQLAKQTLSDTVKVDVTTQYRFLNPLKDADITRDQLEGLIAYTLSVDQGVYEARAAESIELINLNVAESLMRGKYGGAMNRLNSFITAARQGQDVDYAAFQIQYMAMLNDIDSKWQGKYKILFIKFPKEYLKGQIDGIRYIEDEPYALYTACMEYAAAKTDRIAAESDLTKKITTDFEALVTARNASQSLADSVKDAETELNRLTILNRVGKAEYEEVKGQQDDYQALQIDAFDSLATYNDLLIAFDRLCCGAVSVYFTGTSFNYDASDSGLSFPTADGQIWYYIYGDVADMTFVFGLDVPDDFEPDVSEYEVWYENQNLSGRVEADKSFRHLTLDYGDSQTLKVRLFGSDGFVAECEIDTTEARGVLPLENGASEEAPANAEQTIGSYTVETQIVGNANTSTLLPDFNADIGVASYLLQYNGTNIGSDTPVAKGKSFSYLSLLVGDLADVDLLVYDASGKQICKAYFVVSDGTIRTTDSI
jgi:hypothetical protein